MYKIILPSYIQKNMISQQSENDLEDIAVIGQLAINANIKCSARRKWVFGYVCPVKTLIRLPIC